MKAKFDPEEIIGNGSANDNDAAKTNTSVAAAAKNSTALATVEALGALINRIDTNSYGGSSDTLLQYKSRENSWQIGSQRTVPEEGARWIVNIRTGGHGYICFDESNKPTSRMTPAYEPKPDRATLPDTGFEWKEQRSIQLKCLEGVDKGREVVFVTATFGGLQAFDELIQEVKDRFNGGQHEGKLFPIVHLDREDYPHKTYGKTNNPVFTVVGWATAEGPEPESKSPPPPTAASEQPRRRRVGQ